MSHDMPIAPASWLGDRSMYLLTVKKGASKWKMLQLLMDMEKGKHLRHVDVVQCHCVRAFRLEPLTNRGRTSLDGEEIDNGPVQQHVWRHASKVMCMAPSKPQQEQQYAMGL
ncbi:unnamed protein product [Choristocarpus tenellus]